MTRKIFTPDLNWTVVKEPTWHGIPSDPKDYIDLDIDEFINAQTDMGANCCLW